MTQLARPEKPDELDKIPPQTPPQPAYISVYFLSRLDKRNNFCGFAQESVVFLSFFLIHL